MRFWRRTGKGRVDRHAPGKGSIDRESQVVGQRLLSRGIDFPEVVNTRVNEKDGAVGWLQQRRHWHLRYKRSLSDPKTMCG